MRCRHCKALLNHIFIDLNSSPPSNAFLSKAELKDTETCYPIKVMVREKCWLVQTEDLIGADEMFSDVYAYFSSFSVSWLRHAEKYVDNIINRFSITSKNKVAEIAANDGYLLQYFQNKKML